jgi:hypothetical protein
MGGKIYFTTNLDDIRLPDYYFNFLPPIGSRVLCKARTRDVSLEVCGHTLTDGNWRVELHIQTSLGISIKEWHRVYAGVDIY